ncbi:MAG: GNAT family N-acetyltransferase [Candidatus Accumulibacter sp.]|nr:GNAT family N-acetyltransferase [Accumulibacter sp.]
MPDTESAPNIIEPFDPKKHDRTAFSCGIPQVDNYFRNTANKLVQSGNARVYVMLAPDGALIGFYSINAHAVRYDKLPKKFARTRPAHGEIPAAYISMIGRDRRYSGRGFGSDLLADALKRIARAADQVGMAVVMLDVLDCGNPERVARRKALYQGFGFEPIASNPLRMYLPVALARKLLAEEEAPILLEEDTTATPQA